MFDIAPLKIREKSSEQFGDIVSKLFPNLDGKLESYVSTIHDDKVLAGKIDCRVGKEKPKEAPSDRRGARHVQLR